MEFKIPRHWMPNPVRPERMIDNLKNLIDRLDKELKRKKVKSYEIQVYDSFDIPYYNFLFKHKNKYSTCSIAYLFLDKVDIKTIINNWLKETEEECDMKYKERAKLVSVDAPLLPPKFKDGLNEQPQFIYVDDKQQVSFQPIEPMEITITNTKKETKISLSNRLAGMVEKESIAGIIKNLLDLVKEIQKL